MDELRPGTPARSSDGSVGSELEGTSSSGARGRGMRRNFATYSIRKSSFVNGIKALDEESADGEVMLRRAGGSSFSPAMLHPKKTLESCAKDNIAAYQRLTTTLLRNLASDTVKVDIGCLYEDLRLDETVGFALRMTADCNLYPTS